MPIIVKVVKMRTLRWIGHVGQMGEMRNLSKNFTGKPDSMGKPRCRLELGHKIDLKYMGFDIVDWIHLAQGRDQLLAVDHMVVKHPAP
jgi:hypothetical protein